MKRYKKIIILLLMVIITAAYIFRVWYVNDNIDKSVVKEYAKGEIVPYEKDFNKSSGEMRNGYSIEVLDSKVYTREDFIKEFDVDIRDDKGVKFVYKVDTRIYNDNKELNTETGIFLPFLPLISDMNYIIPDDELTLKVNPKLPDISFSLRPESNMEVSIVYELTEPMFTGYSLKQVENENFMICMTQYPVRKMLRI